MDSDREAMLRLLDACGLKNACCRKLTLTFDYNTMPIVTCVAECVNPKSGDIAEKTFNLIESSGVKPDG